MQPGMVTGAGAGAGAIAGGQGIANGGNRDSHTPRHRHTAELAVASKCTAWDRDVDVNEDDRGRRADHTSVLDLPADGGAGDESLVATS